MPVHGGPFGPDGCRGDLGAGAAVALSGAAAATELGNHSNSITASILLLLTRLSSSSASSGAAAAAAAALAGVRARQLRLQPAACRPLPAPSPSHSTGTSPAAPHRGGKKGERELREVHCRGIPDNPGKSCGAARKLPVMDVVCAWCVFACECLLLVFRLAPSNSSVMTIQGKHVFRLMFPISAILSLSLSSTQIHKE